MLSLSYTITPSLRNQLLQAEALRRDILIFPLSPQTELRLRFHTLVKRLHLYSGLPKTDVVSLLSHPSPQPYRGIPAPKLKLLLYKHALDFLHQNWLINSKPITTSTFDQLYQVTQTRAAPKALVHQLLDYLQSENANPIVQAALANYQLALTQKDGPIPILASYLFLFKPGYDVRDLLILEEFLKLAPDTSQSTTLFLEFFVQAFLTQLIQIKSDLAAGKSILELPARITKLTDRQNEILASFPDPQAQITNLKVQRLFGVSQITASRDLAKLTFLGLLSTHGQGRSVYYTRV